MHPFSVHDEFVFITARRQGDPLFPAAIPVALQHPQAHPRPLIEIAAEKDFPCFGALQHEDHLNLTGRGDVRSTDLIFLILVLLVHVLCSFLWISGWVSFCICISSYCLNGTHPKAPPVLLI